MPTNDPVNKAVNREKKRLKEYAELKGVNRKDVDMTLDGDMLLAIEGVDKTQTMVVMNSI